MQGPQPGMNLNGCAVAEAGETAEGGNHAQGPRV